MTRNGLDNFCLAHSPGIRAGYPSAALRRRLSPRMARQVNGRIVIALTANRRYTLDGIRPGTRLATVARRLRGERPFHIGRNTWYVLAGRASHGLLKVQGQTIREVGILSPSLSAGRAAQRRILTSFRTA